MPAPYSLAARLRQDIIRQVGWSCGDLQDPELHAQIDDLINDFIRAVQAAANTKRLLEDQPIQLELSFKPDSKRLAYFENFLARLSNEYAKPNQT